MAINTFARNLSVTRISLSTPKSLIILKATKKRGKKAPGIFSMHMDHYHSSYLRQLLMT
jgi:hypothetical protein